MASKRVLHIVRHAKSSWDYPEISDIDRPLKLRGIFNAYDMARRLKINHRKPQKFISSPAVRAMHTASIFIRIFEMPFSSYSIEGMLYGRGYREIAKVVEAQDTDIKELMIFGHNPDFSELAEHYCKQNYIEMPTCGIVSITFECDTWAEISSENAIDEVIDYPKKEQSL
ncbi:MAG: histidine phosphatase family protein [Bacteroidales bacterium]|nr:histidine phosphatase family protein [Bacteroidales bacterium]